MSVSTQQLNQALETIDQQLKIVRQALAEKGIAQDDGIIGIFDGEFMTENDGKKHQVPPNYASKSMLVAGDTVKMIVDPNGGQTKYKQIGKVERLKTEGVLVKKDGKYEVLSEAGSFKVLSASIKHYDGEVGDTVKIQYPKTHPKGGWAAVVKVMHTNEQPQPPASTKGSPLNPIIAEPQEPVVAQPEAQPVTIPIEDESVQPATTKSTTSADKKPAKPKAASKPKPDNNPKSDTKKKKPESRQPQKDEEVVQQSQPAQTAMTNEPTQPEFDEDDLV